MPKPAEILDDEVLLRHMRDLCPKPGSGIGQVTFRTAGRKPITLTTKTRELLNARLKGLRRRRQGAKS